MVVCLARASRIRFKTNVELPRFLGNIKVKGNITIVISCADVYFRSSIFAKFELQEKKTETNVVAVFKAGTKVDNQFLSSLTILRNGE